MGARDTLKLRFMKVLLLSRPLRNQAIRQRVLELALAREETSPACLHTASEANFCLFVFYFRPGSDVRPSHLEWPGRRAFALSAPTGNPNLLASSSRHGPIDFALGFSLLDVIAPVVLLLAVYQRQFHLHPAALFVERKRDQGVALSRTFATRRSISRRWSNNLRRRRGSWLRAWAKA